MGQQNEQGVSAPPDARPGLIIAAGLGSRLAPEGETSSRKPLVALEGTPLLLRTVDALWMAGCRRTAVVLGHQADRVQRTIEATYRGAMKLEFVVNPRYRLQNGLSVLAARELVGDAFVLTMADHVLDPRIMRLVRDHRPPDGGATLCVDYKIDKVFDLDDATKVVERDGRIVAIGKQLPQYNCVDTGVFVCTGALMEALAEVDQQRGDASLSDGVQALAAAGKMHVLDIGDGFWQDVDTPEMLAHARSVLAAQQ